jgi:import inner membrane translocase subunit TIM23
MTESSSQFYGLCTIGCVGAGYMAGSLLGATGWRLLHRKALPEMEARNQQFQAHLSRFRADPSRQSVSNPVRGRLCMPLMSQA